MLVLLINPHDSLLYLIFSACFDLELRLSYQNRENAGNSSFLIRRDSQDSLDDTTIQAEIDYQLYQQPNSNTRRRSRTHSRLVKCV